MGEVRTESIRREGSSHATVDVMLQTSLGRFPVELKISGGGSMGDLEKIALRELETMLAELLEAVRQKLA